MESLALWEQLQKICASLCYLVALWAIEPINFVVNSRCFGGSLGHFVHLPLSCSEDYDVLSMCQTELLRLSGSAGHVVSGCKPGVLFVIVVTVALWATFLTSFSSWLVGPCFLHSVSKNNSIVHMSAMTGMSLFRL